MSSGRSRTRSRIWRKASSTLASVTSGSSATIRRPGVPSSRIPLRWRKSASFSASSVGELELACRLVVLAHAHGQDVQLARGVGAVVTDLDDLGTALDVGRAGAAGHDVEPVRPPTAAGPGREALLARLEGEVRVAPHGDAVLVEPEVLEVRLRQRDRQARRAPGLDGPRGGVDREAGRGHAGRGGGLGPRPWRRASVSLKTWEPS